MVVVCPVCREVVHVSGGYMMQHGSRYHGVFTLCAGSRTSYVSDCCGI